MQEIEPLRIANMVTKRLNLLENVYFQFISLFCDIIIHVDTIHPFRNLIYIYMKNMWHD